MKRGIFVRSLLAAGTASLLVFSSPAQAGYIVTLNEVGSDVVATGSGAIGTPAPATRGVAPPAWQVATGA
jgi:hypothetical protein